MSLHHRIFPVSLYHLFHIGCFMAIPHVQHCFYKFFVYVFEFSSLYALCLASFRQVPEFCDPHSLGSHATFQVRFLSWCQPDHLCSLWLWYQCTAFIYLSVIQLPGRRSRYGYISVAALCQYPAALAMKPILTFQYRYEEVDYDHQISKIGQFPSASAILNFSLSFLTVSSGTFWIAFTLSAATILWLRTRTLTIGWDTNPWTYGWVAQCRNVCHSYIILFQILDCDTKLRNVYNWSRYLCVMSTLVLADHPNCVLSDPYRVSFIWKVACLISWYVRLFCYSVWLVWDSAQSISRCYWKWAMLMIPILFSLFPRIWSSQLTRLVNCDLFMLVYSI